MPNRSQIPDIIKGVGWSRLGSVSGPLEVRNWRPGDQYRPVGIMRREKDQDLFQQARIPLWERRSWPVVASGDEIVWARRFGPAAEYAAESRAAGRSCASGRRRQPSESIGSHLGSQRL